MLALMAGRGVAIFMIYSFCGWVMESGYCFARSGRWVNRGFLRAPIIPLYGVAGLILIVVAHFAAPPRAPAGMWPSADFILHAAIVFILSLVLLSALQYVSSLLMDASFDFRWWDYSWKYSNIGGRIVFPQGLLWGVLGLIHITVVGPFADWAVSLVYGFAGGWVMYVAAVAVGVYVARDARQSVDTARRLWEMIRRLAQVEAEVYSDYQDKLSEHDAKLNEYYERAEQSRLDWRRSIGEVNERLREVPHGEREIFKREIERANNGLRDSLRLHKKVLMRDAEARNELLEEIYQDYRAVIWAMMGEFSEELDFPDIARLFRAFPYMSSDDGEVCVPSQFLRKELDEIVWLYLERMRVKARSERGGTHLRRRDRV